MRLPHVSRSLLLLILGLSACGEPRYRLEAESVPGDASADSPPRIALLDSTASTKIEDVHSLYRDAAEELTREFADSLASIDRALADLEEPVSRAERRLRTARNNYAVIFKEMFAFTSFGGNPIFDRSDRNVATKKLLEEIADRFYRGKAFSLETGRQIRTMIREKLIPAETKVVRARTALARLQQQQKREESLRAEVAGQIDEAKQELVTQYNRRVVDRLAGAVMREAVMDSSGVFRFDLVPQGRFHLYTPGETPTLVDVLVDGHRRVRLHKNDPSPLITTSG